MEGVSQASAILDEVALPRVEYIHARKRKKEEFLANLQI